MFAEDRNFGEGQARVGPVGRPAIAEWRAESGHVGQQHCLAEGECLAPILPGD